MFVVRSDYLVNRSGESDGRDNFGANRRVVGDLAKLVLGKPAGLVQDVVGDPNLADVVEEGGQFQRSDLTLGTFRFLFSR